ncbi:hypothetical protein CMUS01_13040 [Colletotrichum musicola]|uniref:WSC domain-containing protein n=1 Tax=Colletotrichum musicola TaxID=2175873 RepID=A0A8H6JH06_9PEZI|nr:hypothetical protein CMUS01_13040 [Colletotrichum musicola]
MVSRSRALVLAGTIGIFSTIAYAAQIALPQNDYQYYGCLQPANFNQIFFASNVPTAGGSSVDCQDYCYGLNAAFAAIGNDIGQTCYCSASRPAGVTTALEIRYVQPPGLDNNLCNVVCLRQPSYYCGGNYECDVLHIVYGDGPFAFNSVPRSMSTSSTTAITSTSSFTSSSGSSTVVRSTSSTISSTSSSISSSTPFTTSTYETSTATASTTSVTTTGTTSSSLQYFSQCQHFYYIENEHFHLNRDLYQQYERGYQFNVQSNYWGILKHVCLKSIEHIQSGCERLIQCPRHLVEL